MTGQVKNKDSLKIKCQLAKECSFFQKYKSKKSITWLGIFSSNCCSDYHTHCEINLRYQKNGKFPSADTMPTGTQVSAGFMNLP